MTKYKYHKESPPEKIRVRRKKSGPEKKQKPKGQPRHPEPTTDYILYLQRTVGNKGVEQLIQSGAIEPLMNAGKTSAHEAKTALASLVAEKNPEVFRDLYKQGLYPHLQPKLEVSSPGDLFEQEADRVAEKVVNMSDFDVQRQSVNLDIQTKENTGGAAVVDFGVESGIRSMKGGGQPLPDSTGRYYKARFNRDFDHVRIHTGSRANELARAINARAFTTGNDIFFAKGEYNPAGREGKKLIAHELTHVVQQKAGIDRLMAHKVQAKNNTDLDLMKHFSVCYLHMEPEIFTKFIIPYKDNPDNIRSYYLGRLKGFGPGIGQGLLNTLLDIWELLKVAGPAYKNKFAEIWDDPVGTFKRDTEYTISSYKSFYKVLHKAFKAIKNDPGIQDEILEMVNGVIDKKIAAFLKQWVEKNKTPKDQGYEIGFLSGVLVGEIIGAVVGGKGLLKIGKLSKITKLAKLAKTAKFQAILDRLGLGFLKKLIGKAEDVIKIRKGLVKKTVDKNPVKFVDENAYMSNRARLYNDSAQGARSNTVTQKGQAPQITRILEDGSNKGVRFDGIDINNRVLIDRKLSVVTTTKAKNQALRQSQALSENNLTGRWEVPNQAQANRAKKMLEELKIKNITVKVVKE
ncbi:MAG: DUF4157 domain-containing protein [bacterium]|nr:DUF4157 domain-containing protein [bacterium]